MARPWRTEPLPKGWDAIRKAVLQRDGYRCSAMVHGTRCSETTRLEVDHIHGVGNHRLEALQTLCYAHHRAKTSSQGGLANAKKKQNLKLPRETHPGDIP